MHETILICDRNTFISIGEESTGFGLRAVDFETTTVHRVFQTSNLTGWTAQGGEGGDPGWEPAHNFGPSQGDKINKLEKKSQTRCIHIFARNLSTL